MRKEDIAKTLQGWIDGGEIVNRKVLGETYYTVVRKLVERKYFPTKYRGVFATSHDVQVKFDSFVNDGRIVTIEEAMKRYPECDTRYEINKAFKSGRFIKITVGGIRLLITGEP